MGDTEVERAIRRGIKRVENRIVVMVMFGRFLNMEGLGKSYSPPPPIPKDEQSMHRRQLVNVVVRYEPFNQLLPGSQPKFNLSQWINPTIPMCQCVSSPTTNHQIRTSSIPRSRYHKKVLSPQSPHTIGARLECTCQGSLRSRPSYNHYHSTRRRPSCPEIDQKKGNKRPTHKFPVTLHNKPLKKN